MDIELSPKKVFRILLIIIVFLIIANIMGFIASHYFHLQENKIFSGIITMFDLVAENNVPTIFSATILFLSSLLLLIIAVKHKSMGDNYMAWSGLMLIFLFLSLDEIASIHERFTELTQQTIDTSFRYAWVIPYSVFMVVFVLLFLRFLIKLPKKTMILFIISGTIFVTGAIGFEILGSIEFVQSGMNNEIWDKTILYIFYATIEEGLEMLGISLFIYTLLSYINDQFGKLTIIIK